LDRWGGFRYAVSGCTWVDGGVGGWRVARMNEWMERMDDENGWVDERMGG